MWFRKKEPKVPTVLDAHLFQLEEIDEDLRRLKTERQNLHLQLDTCEWEINYHIKEKSSLTQLSDPEYRDSRISAEQNKALGLASKIADVDVAINKKRQERLELVQKISELQNSTYSTDIHQVDAH